MQPSKHKQPESQFAPGHCPQVQLLLHHVLSHLPHAALRQSLLFGKAKVARDPVEALREDAAFRKVIQRLRYQLPQSPLLHLLASVGTWAVHTARHIRITLNSDIFPEKLTELSELWVKLKAACGIREYLHHTETNSRSSQSSR